VNLDSLSMEEEVGFVLLGGAVINLMKGR